MTRRKGIFKILSVILAVLLLAVGFAGCGEYKPPSSTGGNGPVQTPPDDPVPEGGFTVSLVLRDVIKVPKKDEEGNIVYKNGKIVYVDESVEKPFTSENYSLITKLQAQWTEIDGRAVYRAYFNSKGVARIDELDGDFNVTLVLTAAFNQKYCYDPNPYDVENKVIKDDLVASANKKSVSVPLYEIKTARPRNDIMHIAGKDVKPRVMSETGAYSYKLENETEEQYFMFEPKVSGSYSFMTLIDVTADEVNPIVDLHMGNSQYISPTAKVKQDDGGAEGSYTKNVYLEYQVADGEVGNVMIFKLHSQSKKSDGYPLTVYFIIEWNGTFTRPASVSNNVPVTEDFTKTPDKPDGVLEFVSGSSLFGNTPHTGGDDDNGRHILNQKYVKYNDPADGGDGYYYYVDPATGDFYREADGSVSAQYRIYAVITKPIPVLKGMGREGSDAFLSYSELTSSYKFVVGEDGTAKNYINFVSTYAKYCTYNPDGAYPVNAELKQFLQDFPVSQRYFNDGNGHAEGMGVDSDEDSQWLFACGIYVNN